MAPVTAVLPAVRHEGNRYLRVIDVKSRRVVTVIELLSPSNKELGKDHDHYLAKREEFLGSRTNLVEIDLLRADPRLPMGEPAPSAAHYYAVVFRAIDFPQAAIWPFNVRDPLPTIPIPLDPCHEPVPLNLKTCVDRAYDEACYDREVNYNEPPTPPLAEPDATWARELLAARAK